VDRDGNGPGRHTEVRAENARGKADAMKKLNLVLTLWEEMLGTKPSDPEVHRTFVAGLAPDALSREEEVAATSVDEVVQMGKTIFSKDAKGRPFIWDYMLKGFFKDAAGAMQKVPDSATVKGKLKAYKKTVDQVIQVKPRRIPVSGMTAPVGSCQRPLRAQTPQGERVALADSETVHEGCQLGLQVILLDERLENFVIEWLNYGEMRGLGQWRNSGKGNFVWRRMTEGESALLQKQIDAERAAKPDVNKPWVG
jgi:hypothetical protein